jgi:iron complex transport system ATP-binding protein
LDDISFGAAKGKLTGILGPNGCGKSTLLQNVLGFLNETTKAIQIFGVPRNTMTAKESAKIMAFVPQKSKMNAPMCVYDFVLLGRVPHLRNSFWGYSPEDHRITTTVLKTLHLTNLMTRQILTLSGGEFQMVLLARALTQDTKLLLLDEPTSALDLSHGIALMARLKEEIYSRNITAIAVLHDLNLSSLFCDELILMRQGTVYRKGSPREVLTAENLKHVYGLVCRIFYLENGTPYIIPEISST